MDKIGIAITTRNRANTLDLCLQYYAAHLPSSDKYEYEFWVIHDACDQDYQSVVSKYQFVKYHKNPERLGVAKSKNECLKRIKDCDYIFLMDDDVMPIREDWIDFFIDNYKRTGINHFMYIPNYDFLGIMHQKNGINIYSRHIGVLLFLTKEVIEKVGAFSTEGAAPWGHEHSNYTMRVNQAGLNNGYGECLSPDGVEKVMFSIDFEMNHFNQRPPLHSDLDIDQYRSTSTPGEDHLRESWARQNGVVLNVKRIYEPF